MRWKLQWRSACLRVRNEAQVEFAGRQLELQAVALRVHPRCRRHTVALYHRVVVSQLRPLVHAQLQAQVAAERQHRSVRGCSATTGMKTRLQKEWAPAEGMHTL